MYNQFYGFNKKPFELAPDSRFLYLNSAYQEILATLIYAVNERKGAVALIGEVGTGKTLMLNAMVERLNPSTRVAFLVHMDLTFQQLLMMVLYEFGLAGSSERVSKETGIRRLAEFARTTAENGGNVVIVVDEAQLLGYKTMEHMRMLTNLETHQGKIVQIVLSGQSELDEKLQRTEWRQLAQRISMKLYSYTLSKDESLRYVEHRLRVAGYEGPFLFTARAVELIWQYSEGIPRIINVLCDNALLIGYGLGLKTLDEAVLQEALRDYNPHGILSSSCEIKPSKARIRQFSSPPADAGGLSSGRPEFCLKPSWRGALLFFIHQQLNGKKMRAAMVVMAIAAISAILFFMPN
jgi:general secretion pathway protein A